MGFCEDCGLWHDPFGDCVLRSSAVERIRPSMACMAAAMALVSSLPFNRSDPGELPGNGSWKNGGRCKGRAKKGYR